MFVGLLSLQVDNCNFSFNIFFFFCWGQNKEYMKFLFVGKFNYFYDYLKMSLNDIYVRKKNRKSVMVIVQELGFESNVYGLAKIVMLRKIKRKVMWFLLVIIGFTAVVIYLLFFVIKYLQYNVVEVFEMKDGMSVEFLSVIICNTQVLSFIKLKDRMNEIFDINNWF